jgi:hypothetical protein
MARDTVPSRANSNWVTLTPLKTKNQEPESAVVLGLENRVFLRSNYRDQVLRVSGNATSQLVSTPSGPIFTFL